MGGNFLFAFSALGYRNRSQREAVMSNEWIIEVLSDLRSFSRQNGLDTLAADLDRSLETARREISVKDAPERPAAPQPDVLRFPGSEPH